MHNTTPRDVIVQDAFSDPREHTSATGCEISIAASRETELESPEVVSTRSEPFRSRMSLVDLLWRAAIVLSVALSLVSAVTAARNRIPWSDEGWFSSASHTLATHGYFGTPILDSTDHLTRIERRTYWIMPLFPLGQAVWYKIFPADIVFTRGFTILWGIVLLMALYTFLAALVPHDRVPDLAVCLLALNFVFIDNAGFARPDVMCCALGIAGLAFFARYHKIHWTLALFGSNALIAASLFSHPNGIFHFLALLILTFWLGRRQLILSSFAIAALPYVLALCAWGLYIAQDYPAFHDQMYTNGTNGRWTRSLNPLIILETEIRERYLVVFGFATGGYSLLKSFALIAYLGAIAACLSIRDLRVSPPVRLLLTLLGAYFAFLCVFNQKLSYYLIHIIPWYIALLAVWIRWLWQHATRLRPLIGLAVATLMAVETGGIFLKARTRSYLTTQGPALDFVRSHSHPGDRIIGSASLLYGLQFDPRLHDDLFLGLHSKMAPDIIILDPLYRLVYDAWSSERPQDITALRERLAHYHPSFHNSAYDIYVRGQR